ncbi:MAG: sugar phosphate isomerase/epimerase [Planctomycetota bacterium]|nr:MAG: sugar phosphate isomerase/epimerase [Planctomycetota bacterium]
MPPRETRRGFLGKAAALAGAATLWQQPSAQAIEPIKRNGNSFFKFSLAAYSYRGLLTAKSPQFTLDDFIADCAEMGLEGTELTSYYFPAEPTPEYLRHLKQHSFLLGLDISGTAVRNDFCFPAGEKRDAELAHVKRWVDYAEIMSAPVIRIFSGHAHGTSDKEAHRLAVEGIEECCQYAGEHGVYLALENHGGLTTTADGLLALVRDVQSPWFGVNLDTGNFRSADPYADLARLAPYAVNVQVKVSIHPEGGKRQQADFSRLAQIVGDAGYRGYIVLEFEEREDPREACPRYMDELRGAFAG